MTSFLFYQITFENDRDGERQRKSKPLLLQANLFKELWGRMYKMEAIRKTFKISVHKPAITIFYILINLLLL